MYKVSFKIVNNTPTVTKICDLDTGADSTNPEAFVFKGLIESCSLSLENKFKREESFEYSLLLSYIRLDELQGITHVAPSKGESFLTGNLAFDMEKAWEKTKLPVVFFSAIDLFTNDFAKKFCKAIRYLSFLDSSIWFHYCSFERYYKEVEDSDILPAQYTLSNILSIIVQSEYYSSKKESLYDLAIASEYADLNIRLLRESFLGDGHGDNVSPFLFHSETTISKSPDTEKASKTTSDYHWRFLLLDDKINSEKTNEKGERTGVLSSKNAKSLLTKADILKDRIQQMNIGTCGYILAEDYSGDELKLSMPQDVDIQIVCVETVQKALELMEQNEFDIILLDYLLKDDYGYQLLNKVDKNKKNEWSSRVLVGPQEKNFFMFISAFTTAVNERLTLESLSRDEEWWLIGEGACPTNTPELFKYRLLHLMKRRLDQTGITYLSEEEILKDISEIFVFSTTESPEKRIRTVREQAYKKYHDVLGYHYDYFILSEKDSKKSALVDSFLKDNVHMGALLEHLLQFIHLIAFGTVRQWPEIWEEYQFVARTLNISPNDKQKEKEVRCVSRLIEKYIIDLKSA